VQVALAQIGFEIVQEPLARLETEHKLQQRLPKTLNYEESFWINQALKVQLLCCPSHFVFVSQ